MRDFKQADFLDAPIWVRGFWVGAILGGAALSALR